jgi:hypothetical protein
MMDLQSLDRRLAARAIEEDLVRINSRPVHISIVEHAKSTLEAQLSHLDLLRGVATPEEAADLDAEMGRKRAHLEKIRAELTARAVAERVDSAESNEASRLVPTITWKDLFDQVLEKRKQNGESKTALLKLWLREHPRLCRTQVTDFLAGRIERRVSARCCEKIKMAIRTSAEKLGLPTRTSSD